LRAARFVATLEFDLDPGTEQAIEPSLESFRKVSPERVRDEWLKAMKGRTPSRAFRVMRDHGLLAVTAPLLLTPRADASESPLDVALRAVDAAEPRMAVRFAALLHNVGTAQAGKARADQAAELCFDVLQSLRFSNKDRDRIVSLVRHQTPLDPDSLSDAELRRWLRRVGPELLEDLSAVMQAIARAEAGTATSPVARVQQLFERASALLQDAPPLTIGDLAVTGNDLKQELALPPGPVLGRLLQVLLELVLDEPERNQRALLLAAARAHLAECNTP